MGKKRGYSYFPLAARRSAVTMVWEEATATDAARDVTKGKHLLLLKFQIFKSAQNIQGGGLMLKCC